MMRAVAVLMVLLAGVAAAQEHADFSGAWSAAAGGGRGGRGTAPAEAMGSGWGPDITISQKDGVLTVERVFFSRGDLQPALKFRYALDGTPTANAVTMGRGVQERVCTASWEGDTLVITSVETVPAGPDGEPITSEVRQRLTLRPSGSLVGEPSLLVETTIAGVLGGPPTSTRTVYAKR
jgi:hypothetical protein